MRLVRDTEVAEMLSASRGSVWRWAKEVPGFPQPIRFGQNTTRWDADEIEAYIAGRAG